MTAPHNVIMTLDAVQDVEELHDYIASHDAPAKAAHVLDKIEAAILGLERFPERGAYTKELLALGIRDFRETYFKPYRIIYRIFPTEVVVYLVADGRRDLQTLLQRRMLSSQ
ncbi:type II toxin-antitoxin system RelE/ParE family toxin [Ramlibacter sp.]|uniref:type II toxin-antitoxin system RelE/ParE family toxin n=1 Tax=Ramlibacter sp. TaxID=1917967 RepID=UPI003D0FF427